MSELRWTLLILGVVFIAALSWWERRRPRQAFAPRLREGGLSHVDLAHGGEPRADRHERASSPAATAPEGPAIGRISGEPWIGDTELSDAVLSDVALDAADSRDPDIDGRVRAHGERPAPSPLEDLPTLVIPDEEDQLALRAAWDEMLPEPMLVDPEAIRTAEPPAVAEPVAILAKSDVAPPAAPAIVTKSDSSPPIAPAATAKSDPLPPTAPAAATAPPLAAVLPEPQPEIAGAEGVGAVRIVEPVLPCGEDAGPPQPIVDWPPEDARRIVALRLVAAPPARFSGRTLRLGLAAEGFVLGKFAIFHKPDDANRAVLSAASLTRPGAFDLETMDTQRYAGLSLFAVLPGPKTPAQAFEALLAAARNLNERLEGALQDERGGPLTPLRVAAIREGLRAEAAGPAAEHEH